MPPIFYIIMGPNGAGKSTFGKLHTNGLPIYDPDKRKMEIISYFLCTKIYLCTKNYNIFYTDMQLFLAFY